MGSNRIGYSPRRCKQRELSGPESGNGGNGYVHLSMPLYKSCLDIDRRIISSPPDQRQPLAVPNHNLDKTHASMADINHRSPGKPLLFILLVIFYPRLLSQLPIRSSRMLLVKLVTASGAYWHGYRCSRDMEATNKLTSRENY